MISINPLTYVITIPQSELALLGGSSYQLDTNDFRIHLRDWEDGEDGIYQPKTHNHNTSVLLGGIQYARVLEILSPYTITFEETGTPYIVSLSGSNNNLLEKVNLGTVQILANNSAGLINVTEVQYGAFAEHVTIDTGNITGGALPGVGYPVGTEAVPSNNLTDALAIAVARGFDEISVKGSLVIGATDNISAYHVYGQGATLNVTRTLITFTSGCVTSNASYHDCRITGYQGGESNYYDCIIGGIENAHCRYIRCGLLDGAALGYTIRQASTVSAGHASYFKDCYSDEGAVIFDRNGTMMNTTFDGFSGRIKFINQNHATTSGQVWIHLNGGTITVDASCTKGKITVSGTGVLVNNAQGTDVDATGFLSETAEQIELNVESLRNTHHGFGNRWFVDPVNGTDLAPGTSSSSPLQTVTAAIAKAVSGRGDVIYLISPGAGAATINERVILNKEDVHIRGPGRGVQFQPSTTNLGPVISVTANNCSLSGFVVRTAVGSTTDDGIVISGKFCKLTKLYVVGSGQAVGTGSGIVINAGDYHELIDVESEKNGRSGLLFYDTQDATNGAPRETTVDGGNWYLNGECGIEFVSTRAAGTSVRLNRIRRANIHDNVHCGISIDAQTQGITISEDVQLHKNGVNLTDDGVDTYNADVAATVWDKAIADHLTAGTTGKALSDAGSAGNPWSSPITGNTDAGTFGELVGKKLLTVAKFLGLK